MCFWGVIEEDRNNDGNTEIDCLLVSHPLLCSGSLLAPNRRDDGVIYR